MGARRGFRSVLAGAIGMGLLGCGGAGGVDGSGAAKVAPPPPAFVEPVERFDVVRCGVDDAPAREPRPTDEEPQLSMTLAEGAPAALGEALAALPMKRCAAVADVSDEGPWRMRLQVRADGSVGEGAPLGDRQLTPFARCVVELWCAARPFTPEAGLTAGDRELRFQVARPGRERELEVAVDAEGEHVTEFDLSLVREAARQAGASCAGGFAVPPGAMSSTLVTLTTLRSLTNLRRVTSAEAETAGSRDVPAPVDACMRDRLSQLSWGDRTHPVGPRKVRVVVRWGDDLDRPSRGRRR